MRNWTENQIELVFVRHGATKSNQEHRYLGKTEESLSEMGIDELKRKQQKIVYPTIDVLFSSPMQRCLETAKLLYPMKEIIVIPEWTEMDFGEFEGKNYTDLQNDERYQAWIDSNGTLPFPDGESREEFIGRCKQGFDKVRKFLEQMLNNEENKKIRAGCVVHGGTIMSLLSSFYGGEYFDYQVKNGNGYLCGLEKQGEALTLGVLKKIVEE